MARNRANPKETPRRSFFGKFLHFIFLPLVRNTVALAIIIALIAWQWHNITSWFQTTIIHILGLFGWGLIFVIMAIAALVFILAQRNPFTLLRHWRKGLSAISFALVIWGVLAFLDLGGSVGLNIIGAQDFVGVLRLLGLIVLAIVLLAPRASFTAARASAIWLTSRINKMFSKRRPKEKVQPLKTTTPTQPETRQKKSNGQVPVNSQPELKQVAQEVWKKYGESPDLVVVDGWKLPPIDILDRSPEVQFTQADNTQRARLIEEALASYGVEAKVIQINNGPTVTQFGVEPGWDRKTKEVHEKDKDGNIRVRLEEVSKTRVKVERITSLANDLALALAASSIRIEAPVPGKSVVGIEVPNTVSAVVSLRGVIETNAFQKNLAKSRLTIGLGKGAGGEAAAADLTKMPHLLIAGATGSGKTVCLNATICSFLMHNTPFDVRFLMIDPKRVELTTFNSIPHLAAPVIVDTDKALEALRWLNQEMDTRYKKMATASARNIEAYNKNRQGNDKMPFLVLVIDELADLMMLGGDEVERILCRLAQLARAVGIHLVVATQRPSVDVITGLIKANFPTRISFAVTSQVDSRTILDITGAEKLLGKGDMLYMPTDAAKPKRLQGCFVSDPEMERLVYFWGNQRREEAPSFKVENGAMSSAAPVTGRLAIPEDPLMDTVRQLAREHQHISASFLQRKMRIGYPRAARLMEEFETETGNKPEEGKEEPHH